MRLGIQCAVGACVDSPRTTINARRSTHNVVAISGPTQSGILFGGVNTSRCSSNSKSNPAEWFRSQPLGQFTKQREIIADLDGQSLVLRVNPDIARAQDEERAVFKELRPSIGRDIAVKPDVQLHPEQFDLMAVG